MAAYISVVMAYHNRRTLTIRTLDSIKNSKAVQFIEVILVDDGSHISESVKDLEAVYPFLSVIECDASQKWSYNSCIPYNIGFSAARGKIVVIQNPECYHRGDILSTIYHNFHNPKEYWVAACYSLNKYQTSVWRPDTVSLNAGAVEIYGECGWYNHSVYRPVGYHFLSVIDAKALRELRGFHEIFYRASSYDDDEFLYRVKQKLRLVFRDDLEVLHQWHYDTTIPVEHKTIARIPAKLHSSSNEKIFRNITPHVQDTRWYFSKIPKIAHFSWIGPLPMLNMYTIVTFHALNPDWEIRLYTMPAGKTDLNATWSTGEQAVAVDTLSMFEDLTSLPYVNVLPFPDHIHQRKLHAAQKSDLLRWYLLSTVGGAWFDMDIYFIRPMSLLMLDDCMTVGDAFRADTVVSFYGPNRYIGALMSGPKNQFYRRVYKKALSEVSPDRYQSAGRDILFSSSLHPDTFPGLHAGNLPMNMFYAFVGIDRDLRLLYTEGPPRPSMDESLGIHWYNGARRSREFVKTWKPHVIRVPKTPFEHAMKIQE